MPTWPTITDGVTRLSNALFGLIKTYIDDALTGQGLPSGGATGNLLQKNSATNYDAGWAAPAALTKTDDTNVTLTLGGSSSTALVNAASITAGWTGTLASTRLNSNVVQAITNDTNVTGSIAAQTLTLGWTGTLPAARLNSNVVQAITNDTNVTGSIAAQTLTLSWAGQLGIARGGTGASTQQGALNALAGAVTSGQYLRGNGTNVTMGAIQAGDVPTLNQNTTGSAATLTTTRTLWGQNFNGSANVTGALTSVTSIGMSGNLTLSAGQIVFGSSSIGALYLSGSRVTVRSDSTDAVAEFSSFGMYLPKAGQTAGLYVESPIEARGGLRMGNNAANGTITVGATTNNTANQLVQRDGSGDVYLSSIYASGWFRNYGATGLYNQTYSRGIWEAQAGGATYGNFTTYGTGHNGWSGWTIGTATSFMGRPGVRDFGLYDTSSGWHIYANPSSLGISTSIGGSSPLSGYVLRVEGSLYVNSSVVIGGNTAWHAGNMDAPNKSGTSYYQANTWLQFNGNYGDYWPSASGWSSAPHLHPSTSQSYGSLEVQGQKNSYAGFSVRDDSNKRHYLIGESGNFGLLLNNAIIWVLYYSSAGNNVGYGGASTVGGYSHTFHGAAWFHNAVYVNSSITATGTKSFDITHPVAPTKRLRYASIESPRIDVLHRGVATVSSHAVLDLDTEAQLLPGTSAALMRDLQCQLTNLSDTFCQLRGRLDGTTLHIYTDNPEPITVAWLVLGERQDKEIKATVGTDADGRLISEYDADPIIGQPIPGPSVAALQQE